MTEVCDHYGVSRKTFYKWQGRYRQSGRDFHLLRDRSRRPHSHPRSVPGHLAERVVSMRRRTRYGPRRISRCLAQEGVTISVYGVYRVLQRAGLVRRRRSRPRRKPRSYAMAVPGQPVQIDVKYLPPLHIRERPEPLKQYLYNAIDDCTGLQVAPVSSELTPKASRRFLRPVKRSFPFPIQEVQTDHGTEFTYIFFPHVLKPHPFQQALAQSGIRHKLIPVGRPPAERQGGTVPPHPRRGMPQFPVLSQAQTQGARHQALDQLLQLPAPTLRPPVEHPPPEAAVLRYLPECYPCLKSVHSPSHCDDKCNPTAQLLAFRLSL